MSKLLIFPLLLIILWFPCGYFARGLALGEFTHRYPWNNHQAFANGAFIFGVSGLIVELLAQSGNEHYYYRQTPMTKEQRWEAYHKMWPSLTREDFEREN